MRLPRGLEKVLTALVLLAGIGLGAVALHRTNTRQDEQAREVRAQAQDAYEQDVRSWAEKVGGCVRNKTAYLMEREGWRSAQRARLEAASLGGPTSKTNRDAAEAYGLIIDGYSRLIAVGCFAAFPEPRIIRGAHRSAFIDPTIRRARLHIQDAYDLQRRIHSASLGLRDRPAG